MSASTTPTLRSPRCEPRRTNAPDSRPWSGRRSRLGRARHDVKDGVTVLVARCDVEKGELVGAGGVVDSRLLDRIAGDGDLFAGVLGGKQSLTQALKRLR